MPQPLGPMTTPIQVLAEMIACCQTFQERAGLTYPDVDVFEKLLYGERGARRIWYPSLESEDYPRMTPFAVVSPTDRWSLGRKSGGGRNYHPIPEGTLQVFLAIEAVYPGDMPQSFLDALNYFGVLARELTDQSGAGGKLSLADLRTVTPVHRTTEAEEASLGRGLWFCAFEADYGI